jgi:hypothetical protein
MQFALADAQRKERMGNIRGAQAAMETARKERADANRFKLNKAVALSTLDAKALQSLRPAGKGAGSGADKEQPLDRVTAAMNDKLIEMRAKDPNDPQIAILEDKIQGRLKILTAGKEGPTVAPRAAAALTAKQNSAVMKQMDVWEGGGEARKAKADGTIDAVRAAKKEALRQDALRGVFDDDEGGAATPTAKPGTVLNYDKNGKRIN